MAINRDINDQYLDAMGVQIYRGKEAIEPQSDAPVDALLEAMDMQALSKTVEACVQCELTHLASQKISGSGNTSANWFFVSDKPAENSTGFLSAVANQLLEGILLSVNEKSQSVYTTTAIKCSQNERPPTQDEFACCTPYLAREIALVQPSVVVILGETAAQQILAKNLPIEQLRGKTHTAEICTVPVVVTYHPEQLLNTPSLKRAVWQDFQIAKTQVLN
jgi:DNA polymerase